MHRGTKDTIVLALTKWFQKGHKSKVVDGKRIFPPEDERDKNVKRIRREIRRLEPPMCESMEDWLDGLLLYGEADWYLAVMESVPDGELHEELVRQAQVPADRRVSTVQLLHSTPWMAAFHRLRGRGRHPVSQAFRWVVAAGIVGLLLWLISWPYRAIEDFVRFGMERSNMEPETINLWAPQVMKFLILILVLYAIYGIFRKSPEEREVTVRVTESDDDTASETTVVKKKEEKKTTTKSSRDWGWLKPVLAVAAIVVLVLLALKLGQDLNGPSRAEPAREAVRVVQASSKTPEAPHSWQDGFAAGRIHVPVVDPPPGAFTSSYDCDTSKGLCTARSRRPYLPAGYREREVGLTVYVLIQVMPNGSAGKLAISESSRDGHADAGALALAGESHWCLPGPSGCNYPPVPTWIEERYTF